MARLIRKTAKVSGSGGGKINVRGREWTKEDLRELKNHSREKTPATTIAKSMKRTVGALRQKAFILGLPLGRSSREWTKEDLRELKRYARQKPPATTIAKSMKRTVAAVKRKAITLGLSLGRPVREWTKEGLRELKSHLRKKAPVTTIAKQTRPARRPSPVICSRPRQIRMRPITEAAACCALAATGHAGQDGDALASFHVIDP